MNYCTCHHSRVGAILAGRTHRCGVGKRTHSAWPRPAVWALLWCALLQPLSAQRTEPKELHLFFTGDLQGFLQQDDRLQHGGALSIQHTLHRLTQTLDTDDYLIFDTGDLLSYYYLSHVDSGRTAFSILQQGGCQAVAPGNFDLTFGWKNLLLLNRHASMQFLSANLLAENRDPLLPACLFFQKQGLRIAVVGLCDPNMGQTVAERNLAGVQISDPVQAYTRLTAQLAGRYDLMIVLSHLEFERNLALCRVEANPDLIISPAQAESPEEFSRVRYGNGRRTTVLVQAPKRAWSVGHLVCQWQRSDDRCRLTQLQVQHESLQPDSSEDAALADLQRRYNQQCLERYGRGADEQVARVDSVHQEEDFLHYTLYTLMRATHSEVALINQGYFRWYPVGERMTIRDVERIAWSNDQVRILRLRGKTLKQLAQRSRSLPAGSNRKLHFLSIQPQESKDPESWTVHGKPLQDEEEYAVVTTQFLSSCGDGYLEFADKRYLKSRFLGFLRIISDAQGREVTVNELLIRHLCADVIPDLHAVYERRASDPFLTQPLWQLCLQQIDLSWRDVRVANTLAYQTHSEPRINRSAQDSRDLGLMTDIRLKRESPSVQWQSGLWVKYHRTTVLPESSSPLTTRESNLELSHIGDFIRVSGKARTLMPFVGLRLDSDLSFHQRDLIPSLGFRIGRSASRSLRLAVVAKWNARNRIGHGGLEMNGAVNQKFFGLALDSWLRMRYLARGVYVEQSHERWSFEWRNSLKVAISEHLLLRPGLEAFYYMDYRSSRVARNVQYFLNLSYSRAWKFQYQRFYRREE
ncbi:MAG TPA: 5'-nucleotidase C-terminal domain-containing protein [bacterium]|nr:5'-nucleotidase C-terminal domain-containing protein [bacterium]